MPRFSISKYPRAIIAFILLFLLFAVVMDVLIVSGQRTILMSQEKKKAQGEIALMDNFIAEPLLRGEFGIVEEFLQNWCDNNEDVVLLRATAPNGFVVAECERPASSAEPLRIERVIRYDGRHLLDLHFVKDMLNVQEDLEILSRNIIIYSVIGVGLLALLLWNSLRSLALEPLEKEIHKRQEVEKALSQAKSDLELRVQERTEELQLVNLQLQSEVVERRRTENELKQNYEIQTIVNAILHLTQTDMPLETFLKKALEFIMQVEWLAIQSMGCIYLVEDSSQNLVMKASIGLPHNLLEICKTVPAGKCLCGNAAKRKEVVFASFVDERHEIVYEGMPPHGHYCVPILLHEQILGLLCVYLQEGHERNEREIEFLQAITNTMSTIIENKRRSEQSDILEATLQQAQKMESIGTLAGGIAHDFNNILTPIIGYTDMLKEDFADDNAAVEKITQVYRAAMRARDLVTQILSFSRQTESKRSTLELSLILDESLKLLRASIPTTIDIVQDISPDCGFVLADPSQMHQMVMNLCTNAYQAMRDRGGTLNVSLAPIDIGYQEIKGSGTKFLAGSYLLLRVSDTGAGITKDIAGRIFEPYFSTKKQRGGTGMGLAVVHGIVKSHGGHIVMNSEPGVGTRFSVYLPQMSPIREEKKEERPPEILPRGNERILLVDDEPVIVDLQDRILNYLGYKTVCFTNSKEALMHFIADPQAFDLIITDMTMPLMTGLELAKSILELRPEMPIIICTGFSEIINEEKALAIGIRGYIMKPVVRDELAMKVRGVLDMT